MKRYAVMVEVNPVWRAMNPEGAANVDAEYKDFVFLSFRTRFFAQRDMRMLSRTRDGIMDYVLVDRETGRKLMRS